MNLPKPRKLTSGLIGALAVGLAAMLFAAKGVFAKELYELGVSVEALVAIRASLALPMFWAFAVRHEGLPLILTTPKRAICAAAAVGILCYYAGALLDFIALTLIKASIERVLIFSYPAIVVLLTSVRDRQWPNNRVLMAIILTYLGIFFSMGGFDSAEMRANLYGASLVIASAVTYAIYFLVSEKYTRQIGSSRFTLFAMSASAAALIPHYLIHHSILEITEISAEAWLLLIGISVVCMFLPALLQAEGVRRIGAQRGAVISTIGPPTTAVLATLLLGEQLSIWQIGGVTLIVTGVFVLDLARNAK